MSLPDVILHARRAQPFYGRHPWVYAGAIDRVQGSPEDGGEVNLLSHAGNFVARGLYNSRSKIVVRLYSWQPDQVLDEQFFRERLMRAERLRSQVLGLSGAEQGYRLVFSEADGLSGMTVDRFAGWLVVQFTSLALAQRREMIARLLMELCRPQGIYLRTERGIGSLEGLEISDGPLLGEPPPKELTIEEAGLHFRVDLAEGQKTGFYLDQRENRRLVARYASGRRVLDAFCYSGGFALHAAKAGAASVDAVDVSEAALSLGRANAELNGLTNIQFIKSDVFRFLDERMTASALYDLIVLDPPKFARTRQAVPEALRGYRRLLTLGVRLTAPSGILVLCCCSGAITSEMLEELTAQTAIEEKRDIRIIDRLTQPADHPISATCLETAYLKGLAAVID